MTLIATCHCGATRLELAHAPTEATRCTCTFCSKSGALWIYYKPEEVRIVSNGSDAVYSASGYNLHHFCAHCGTRTFSDSPEWSLGDTEAPTARKYGVNALLLDDFDIARLPVSEIDGRNLW